jgi:hypothetical protein
MWPRCKKRPGNDTLPGARLCKAALNTSMHVNADATLVEVETAGKIPPASTFALKYATKKSDLDTYNVHVKSESHRFEV